MRSARIRVIGKVQGVFFRVSTKEQADKLGLAGWVKNDRDGSVLMEVEGDDVKVDELIAWCKLGSATSSVERVEVEDIPSCNFKNFTIKYW